MKKIYLLIIIFIVTGCTTKYTINFKDDGIYENITNYVYKSDFEKPIGNNVDEDNEEYSLYGVDFNPLISSNDIYEKEITNFDDYDEITLSYKYNYDNYENSMLFTCFDHHDVSVNGKNVNVHLYGKFNCSYGDDIEIILKSNRYIKDANGKNKNGTYTWYITQDDNNVDIKFNITEMSKLRYNILKYIGLGVLGIILIIILYYVLKFFNNKDVNEI